MLLLKVDSLPDLLLNLSLSLSYNICFESSAISASVPLSWIAATACMTADSIHLFRELDGDLGLRDACLESWDGLDTELPVVHALADGEKVAGSYVVEVKLSDGFLGITQNPVADVTEGPVDSAELNHQPKLKNPPAGGEYGDELVLEAISWDPVAVHLSALGRLRPGVVRIAVDPLAVPLVNFETSLTSLVREHFIFPDILLLFRI